ncbi:MAG: NAD(P)/FAD-dependent oxidoreductase [Negativicutes bacterium]|nr:NAD(P)/FAD-dependent oxidoreductase [Negativicutes bacterium]
MNDFYDVVVIGGGPAGLAAALSARRHGAGRVLIVERDRELGGILQQCIHVGFGLHRFREELTGPGYANRYLRMLADTTGIETMIDTMVISLTADRQVTVVGPAVGLRTVRGGAVVLAMGCRERTRGAIRIPGSRPAGVFTAGAAQRMVNMEGYLPGREVVILGSGDIGLIMARRLTLEGCRVPAVLEIMPVSNGLTRNIVQCLDDFGIPLYLSHTVVAIRGQDRVTGVTVARVDDALRPVAGSQFDLACDCLLLSVGLIPEVELAREVNLTLDGRTSGPVVDNRRQTSLPGFFAAGNVVHVHDLVDFVSEEGEIAGRWAAVFAAGGMGGEARSADVLPGEKVRSVVPQKYVGDGDHTGQCRFYLRVSQPLGRCRVTISDRTGRRLASKRLPVAKPSEMIEIDVQHSAIEIEKGPLTVAAEGV